eukprot:scaffold7114_cov106-Cylindrotheca_fusiformis.AAC.3
MENQGNARGVHALPEYVPVTLQMTADIGRVKIHPHLSNERSLLTAAFCPKRAAKLGVSRNNCSPKDALEN